MGGVIAIPGTRAGRGFLQSMGSSQNGGPTGPPAIVHVTLDGGLSEQKIDAKIEGATDQVMVTLGNEADRRFREGRV